MGMFDSLMVPCPQCGEDIEYQSKAGECVLTRFDINDVPACIADDVNDELQVWSKCEADRANFSHDLDAGCRT